MTDGDNNDTLTLGLLDVLDFASDRNNSETVDHDGVTRDIQLFIRGDVLSESDNVDLPTGHVVQGEPGQGGVAGFVDTGLNITVGTIVDSTSAIIPAARKDFLPEAADTINRTSAKANPIHVTVPL